MIMTRVLRDLLFLAVAGITLYAMVVRPWLVRWGATDLEREKSLPGDELVPSAKYNTTHSLTVHAPAEAIWPWIIQLGQGRGGFYSYDWIENLIGLDIHSADRIIPELQSLNAGDTISLAPENAMPMWVTTFDPPRALVLSTGHPESPPHPGNYLKSEIAGSWAFILEPIDETTTRFIVRFRSDWEESLIASVLNLVMLEPAHCTMERSMMLGIKERAERTVASA
jgi:hypothetical protein